MIKEEFSKRYLEVLDQEFSGLNLTNIKELDEFHLKQVMDSILPLEVSSVFRETIENTGLLIDVGFGGGFPLLPLAYKLPHVKFVGFEARRKKADAVRVIAEKLGLTNVKVYHHRCEEVLIDQKAVVTFKAVGKVDKFIKLLKATDQLCVFFYKGPKFDELEDLSKVEKNWFRVEDQTIELEGQEGRRLVGFANKKVPCGTMTNVKQLIKISSLI